MYHRSKTVGGPQVFETDFFPVFFSFLLFSPSPLHYPRTSSNFIDKRKEHKEEWMAGDFEYLLKRISFPSSSYEGKEWGGDK